MIVFFGVVSFAFTLAGGFALGYFWNGLSREINETFDGWSAHHCVSHDAPITLVPRHFLPTLWQIFLKRLADQPGETMVTQVGARVWRVLDELKLVHMTAKSPSKTFRVTLTGFGHVLVKWL